MSGNCWTRIFLILYVLGLSLGAVQRSYKFAIKEANSILTDHVVAEKISISLLKCAIMCTDNPDCLSLNYHKLERKCEINSATADQFPADLVPRENVNHLSEMGGKVNLRKISYNLCENLALLLPLFLLLLPSSSYYYRHYHN